MVEMFDEYYMAGGSMSNDKYNNCRCENQVNSHREVVNCGCENQVNSHREVVNCRCENQVNSYREVEEYVIPGRYECNNCVLENIGYAQAYVPYQETRKIMTQEKSLACGTIFTELVDPYVKGSSLRRRV